MISNYQILRNESLKKKELIINLSFDRQSINNFFFLKGISYADLSKTTALLFPVLVEKDNFYIFSNNFFYKNWNTNDKRDKENQFIEYIMPIENLEYVQFIQKNKNNLESIDINELLTDYDVENYVFIIIRPSDKKNNIFLKSRISGNNIVKNFEVNNFINSDKISNFEKTRESINAISNF